MYMYKSINYKILNTYRVFIVIIGSIWSKRHIIYHELMILWGCLKCTKLLSVDQPFIFIPYSLHSDYTYYTLF